jgi:hypothetical protein
VEHEWQRFLAYGDKIQDLTVMQQELSISESWQTQTWDILANHRPRTWLLPQLKTLNWDLPHSDVFPFSLLFVHPSLQGLAFGGGESSPALVRSYIQLLEAATSHCSCLRTLCLRPPEPWRGLDSNNDVDDAMSRLVLASELLEKLDGLVVVVSPAALRHLATLTTLTDLSLCNNLDPLEDLYASTGAQLGDSPPLPCLFMRIESLDAFIDVPEKLPGLLQSIGSGSWQELQMTSASLISGRTLFSVAQVLKAHASVRKFERLLLEFGERRSVVPFGAHETDYIIRRQHLEPFLSLPALRTLSIRGPFVSIDDVFLQKASTSWPFLECLCLDCKDAPPSHYLEVSSSVTMAGLAALLATCPRLHLLQTLVHASSAVEWRTPAMAVTVEAVSDRHAREITLDVLHSDVQPAEVDRLVTALRAICPASARLKLCWTTSSTVEEAIDHADELDMDADGFRVEMERRSGEWARVKKGLAALRVGQIQHA